MDTLEVFKRNLQEALVHIHNPGYRPADDVYAALGRTPEQEPAVTQAALISMINDLEPEATVPVGSRSRQIFDVLHQRFVLELTQEETAERLSMSVRSVQRIQQRAVYMLARRLWEESRNKTPSVAGSNELNQLQNNVLQNAVSESASVDADHWQTQLKQELMSLQHSAPEATADVETVIDGVLKLGRTLTARQNINLSLNPIQPDLSVAVHPTAMRQILLTAIEKLVQQMSSGEITLGAEPEEQYVNITIEGQPFLDSDNLPDSHLIREILMMQGGKVDIDLIDSRLIFQIKLPYFRKEITVLVVDDNADLVNFYRNYTTGTRYEIVHLAEGKRFFDTIEAKSPDIIVLDVMLPDTDGWELLTYLRQHPATRIIPVIVCSVVKREDLALALGATLYLPKPVRLLQFIRALDQVLELTQAETVKTEANNSTSG